MKLGSLFSGYGGLDQAIHAAFGDITTAWVSDFDTGPCKILAHRYPNVPNLGDITRIDWTQVEPVDIIAGGSPCQDVSQSGRRAGMKPGTRSGLWESMREAIAIIQPTYVVWENVLGALSAEANSDSEVEYDQGPMGDAGRGPVLRALGRVLGDLTSLGYDAGWTTIRASDVGAPHGRARVFVVAWRRGAVAEDALCGGSGGRAAVAGDSSSAREDSPAYRPDSRPDPSRQREVALLPTPTTSEANGPGAHGTGGADLRTTISLLPTPVASDANGARNATAVRSPGSKHSTGTTLGDVAFADMWGTYAPAIERWEHVIGRPAPAPTEPNGKNRPRLSPRFVEWMMGLPEGWVTDTPGITRNQQLKALGNGVVPLQCEAALRHLQEVRDAYM